LFNVCAFVGSERHGNDKYIVSFGGGQNNDYEWTSGLYPSSKSPPQAPQRLNESLEEMPAFGEELGVRLPPLSCFEDIGIIVVNTSFRTEDPADNGNTCYD
jgi:hypothetical protein